MVEGHHKLYLAMNDDDTMNGRQTIESRQAAAIKKLDCTYLFIYLLHIRVDQIKSYKSKMRYFWNRTILIDLKRAVEEKNNLFVVGN